MKGETECLEVIIELHDHPDGEVQEVDIESVTQMGVMREMSPVKNVRVEAMWRIKNV
jgi:hypothetical protein